MQVNEKTKYREFAPFIPYLEQSSIRELKKAAEAKYGNPWGITIGQFFECSDGDWSLIGVDRDNLNMLTVLQYYWMESFRCMCTSLAKAMKALTVLPTAEAKEASAACRPMTTQETIKVFCREYFGLHTFREVEELTLDDLLLAKKDSYNKAIFEKTMGEIMKIKSKRK